MKEFWEEQAEKYKDDIRAVNFDLLEEEIENYYLDKIIPDHNIVCDLGCGNGRTIFHLAASKKNSLFYGIDFAKGMIDIANEKKEKSGMTNVFFYNYDVVLTKLPGLINISFDIIFTKRLLINLAGNLKYLAINNIHAMLKKDGMYIMEECFIEPLQRINEIRKKINLSEIKVRDFNEFLSHNFLKAINDKFDLQKKIDFASFYYFISRIFNAYLSKGEPDYCAPINKLCIELTKIGVNPIKGGYSPEMILLLKKK